MEIIIILIVILRLFLIRLPALFLIILCAGFFVYLIFGLAIEFLARKHTINSMFKKLRSVKLFRKLINKFRRSFPGSASLADLKNPLQFFRQHKVAVIQATFLQL